jgi:hypothetical protein
MHVCDLKRRWDDFNFSFDSVEDTVSFHNSRPLTFEMDRFFKPFFRRTLATISNLQFTTDFFPFSCYHSYMLA